MATREPKEAAVNGGERETGQTGAEDYRALLPHAAEGVQADWHPLGLVALIAAIGLIGLLAPPPLRVSAWLGILALLVLLVLVIAHGVTGRWQGTLVDGRNKMSLSRLQLALWTLLVLSGFLAAALSNIRAGQAAPLAIAIPAELWLLLGISVTSLVGSPLILNRKHADEPRAEVARRLVGQVAVNDSPEDARWSDLFRGRKRAAQRSLIWRKCRCSASP